MVVMGYHGKRMQQKWAVARPWWFSMSGEGIWFFFFCMLKGCLQVVSTSSLHPASHELATPGATEKGHSPCDRAACAVFLGWSSALGTRGFTDLAVAMLIDVFSWGTKSSCLSCFYMRAARSLCGYEKTVETIQREETLNGSATSPKSWPYVTVVQLLSHVRLCNAVNCSMPGFPVLHYLPEFAQTHVHWVSDAIQPSLPLLSPSPPAFYLSQYQSLSQWVSSSHQVAKVLELQLQHQSFQWIFRVDFLYSYHYYVPTGPRS